MHSKNYERYLEWFKRGSISEEQIGKLYAVGLITYEEKESILHWNDSETAEEPIVSQS